MLRVVMVSLALGCVGCYPDLPTDCDDESARTVVYDPDGIPMYAGQAILHASCGASSLCHAEAAVGDARYGVPAGLDFGLSVATTGPELADESTARLAREQRVAYQQRFQIALALRRGAMPPEGEWELLDFFVDADGVALPPASSESGRAIVEEWLACGAPVVERTTFSPLGETAVGDVVRPGEPRTAEPTFTSLFARLFYPRCGISCHGPNVPAQMQLAGLDLSTPEVAYRELLRPSGAAGQFCDGEGPLVVPGSPEDSLLLQKLAGTQECGDPMPTGVAVTDSTRASVEEWISRGALND